MMEWNMYVFLTFLLLPSFISFGFDFVSWAFVRFNFNLKPDANRYEEKTMEGDVEFRKFTFEKGRFANDRYL